MKKIFFFLLLFFIAMQTMQSESLAVGRLGDSIAVGYDVRNMIIASKQKLDIVEVTTTSLTASFFSQIKVFFFGNAFGGSDRYSLTSDELNNLKNFVKAGGYAYLGINECTGSNGAAVASLFGFSLSSSYSTSSVGTITHPLITQGPFQPASNFVMSYYHVFTNSAPAGTSYIGSVSNGNAVALVDAGALGPSSGKVLLFTDECVTGVTQDHLAIFNNFVYDAGADIIPEANCAFLAGLGFFLLLLKKKKGS